MDFTISWENDKRRKKTHETMQTKTKYTQVTNIKRYISYQNKRDKSCQRI